MALSDTVQMVNTNKPGMFVLSNSWGSKVTPHFSHELYLANQQFVPGDDSDRDNKLQVRLNWSIFIEHQPKKT